MQAKASEAIVILIHAPGQGATAIFVNNFVLSEPLTIILDGFSQCKPAFCFTHEIQKWYRYSGANLLGNLYVPVFTCSQIFLFSYFPVSPHTVQCCCVLIPKSRIPLWRNPKLQAIEYTGCNCATLKSNYPALFNFFQWTEDCFVPVPPAMTWQSDFSILLHQSILHPAREYLNLVSFFP